MAETKAIKKVGDGINLELDGISGGADLSSIEARLDALEESGGGGGGTELKYVDKVVNKTDLTQTTGNYYQAQISFAGSFTNPVIVNIQLIANMGVDACSNLPSININSIDGTLSQFIDMIATYVPQEGQGMIGIVTVYAANLAQLQDSLTIRVWYYEAQAET